jgi:hypothetical protein
MTWTNTIGFIDLQGSLMIATDSPPPTRRHAERSEASALALVTTQAQSKSATDSPRQRTVTLSAAKHLRLLLSQLRHNPNSPQILPATYCHAERSEASAVALVCPTHLTTWCDFPRHTTAQVVSFPIGQTRPQSRFRDETTQRERAEL